MKQKTFSSVILKCNEITRESSAASKLQMAQSMVQKVEIALCITKCTRDVIDASQNYSEIFVACYKIFDNNHVVVEKRMYRVSYLL